MKHLRLGELTPQRLSPSSCEWPGQQGPRRSGVQVRVCHTLLEGRGSIPKEEGCSLGLEGQVGLTQSQRRGRRPGRTHTLSKDYEAGEPLE